MSKPDRFIQSAFPGMCPITEAIESLSAAADTDLRGAVFTRREVVDFVLDLSGYTVDRPLHTLRLLEPSFGAGDFLIPAIERLLMAWHRHGVEGDSMLLSRCIRAVEVHRPSFVQTKQAVCELLEAHGIPCATARILADGWLICDDFLLTHLPECFDVVVGNPPYVRQELIPSVLLAEYRQRYVTIYDRADLYVPFIERSLNSLVAGGLLTFICADRWMKNKYGGPLRAKVAAGFNLRIHVDMSDTPAFHSNVIAYPAITVIAKEDRGVTRIARRPKIDSTALSALSQLLRTPSIDVADNEAVQELFNVSSDSEPWLLEPSDQMALLRRLEAGFPTLADAACKVGIGVATGADRAFIGPFDELDVEEDRKLPLVTTRDIDRGEVHWRGLGVVNPFLDSGELVPLIQYPRLRAYLEARRAAIENRHVARKSPNQWYRTIDRITPSLAAKPKLLIPDIKGEANVVYEGGHLYPHHNLYFILSEEWDLHALQAVLLSGIARLFVSHYSTKMQGGFLRFQAQYLRRIRVPIWADVTTKLRDELTAAGRSRNSMASNRAVCELYKLSRAEQTTLLGSGGWT